MKKKVMIVALLVIGAILIVAFNNIGKVNVEVFNNTKETLNDVRYIYQYSVEEELENINNRGVIVCVIDQEIMPGETAKKTCDSIAADGSIQVVADEENTIHEEGYVTNGKTGKIKVVVD